MIEETVEMCGDVVWCVEEVTVVVYCSVMCCGEGRGSVVVCGVEKTVAVCCGGEKTVALWCGGGRDSYGVVE